MGNQPTATVDIVTIGGTIESKIGDGMRWEAWVLVDAVLAMFAYMGYVVYVRSPYRCPVCYTWWNHHRNTFSRPNMKATAMSICRNCGRQF